MTDPNGFMPKWAKWAIAAVAVAVAVVVVAVVAAAVIPVVATAAAEAYYSVSAAVTVATWRATSAVSKVASKGAAEPTGLFRETANTGEFKGLSEPMQLKNVKSVAKDAGAGLDGIKVRIVRDPDLIGKGLYGYTHSSGKLIDLYPDAFTDTETLVKTLGHERIHVYQMKTLGPVNDSAIGGLYEKGAEASEASWWQYYNVGGK